MHRNDVVSGCLAVLLIAAVVTRGIVAQVTDKRSKEAPTARDAEKAPAAKTPQAPAKKLIELQKCSIELVDSVTLASDRAGIVAFVGPREGDIVHEGDLVAGLQEDVAKATLAIAAKEAESDVDIRYSQKAGEVAEAEHQKALEANRNVKAIPEVEVRRLKLAAEKTVLELESARHRQAINVLKRDEAQAQLETFRIKAPFEGVVTRVHRSKGEAVRQGDQVLELVSTKRVRVEGMMDIRDVWYVRRGNEVDVQLEITGTDLDVVRQTFPGRIVFVDVKAEPVSQTVRVWAEVENSENVLRAGLMARMKIHAESPAAANEK